MTDIPIPASLKITPEQARDRFFDAAQYLVGIVGAPNIATRINVHRSTVSNWAKREHEPAYSIAIFVIAWSDLEREVENLAKSRQGAHITVQDAMERHG